MSEEYKELQFAEDGEVAQALNQRAIDTFKHPAEELEPVELSEYDVGFRDGYKRCFYVINCALSDIIAAAVPLHQAWAVAFALGSAVCCNRSMSAIGETLGIGRAAVSKAAVAFAKSLNLPPSPYMKSKKQRATYRAKRLEYIKDNNERQP